ncbi:MAG: SPASM domain-containing protein, partial [Oligoflexia bacterium]|nr:SPASM domain-containing protein [Oligoflexia bacterium]
GITYRPFLLNEPFTDKRMLDICAYIRQDRTAKIEFNTNAGLLTPELSDKLIELDIECIRFSIDGFYKEEYAKRRRGLDLDIVAENTEYFCKHADKNKTFTNVRMIAFPGTEKEQELFIEKWSAVASKAEITMLYRYPWEGQEEVVYKPCLKIRKEMFFYVDGRAALCCWDTSERAVIGNVKDRKVTDIWNGEPLKTYRSLLDLGQRDKINLCSRCDAYKNTVFDQ